FHHKVRGIIFRLFFLLTGALTILIPWLVFLYLPHRESINAFNNLNLKYLLPPPNLTKILEYFWTRPPLLLDSMPILAVLAGIISLVLLHHIFVRTKKVHLTDWIFLNWFFAGSIYLSIIYQRVPRRFIVQIVPLVFLAVSFLPRLFSKKQTSSPSKPPLVFAAAVFVWALFPVSLFLKWLNRTSPKFFEGQVSLSLALLIISLGLAVLVYGFTRVSAKKSLSIPRPASAVLVGVLALLFLISHGSRYLKWAIHPPHQLQNISQDYGRAFDHAVFVGLWAPIISMENNHRAYEFFPNFINDDKNLFEKRGITHIFTTTAFGENQTYWRHFPHIRKKARLLARYHIWNIDALLYDVQGFPLPEGQSVLEAERHTLEGAMPRFDEKASGRFAVRPLFRRPGYVADIPVPQPYEKGIHSITAVLKRDKKRLKEESRIGRLEVLTEDGSDILGYRDIFPIDLNQVEYREIPISFHVRRPGAVRVRLYTQGNVVIWFDRLENSKQHP
ncbi:MAG: hypothetical protein MUP70_16410, partial [Candidatus Aminicenantes bacterium]|nr:hypothetical protein [Candidatus Aminicenantes bacterium]